MSIKMFCIINFNKILVFLKKIIFGFLIGVSVIAPGMSGGTTAMFLGVFEEIISNANDCTKHPFRCIKNLFPFVTGSFAGLFLVSAPIKFLSENYSVEFSYFIMGIIVGGSLTFLNGNTVKNKNKPIYILIGLSVVLLQNVMFDLVKISNSNPIITIIIALFSSIALILPGISLTNVLIMFGIYTEFITAINELDIKYLALFTSFLLIGIVIFIKVFNALYSKHKDKINLVLLGMTLASLQQIYIRLPDESNIVTCILLFFGAFAACCISTFFKKGTN